MKLLQVTILCLLSSLCSSKGTVFSYFSDDIQNGTTPLPTSSMISAPAPTTSVITPRTTSSPNPTKAITGVSPEETTNKSLQTSLLPTLSSLTTTVKGNTTNGVTKNKFITANATETNLLLPNVVSTLQSSQHMTENQNSTKTTGKPVTSGTPENGNDQPQSDKESVKLLTVKTISHEYGEHSAQGKNKN
uniref:Endomucin n=1 Tax=Rousettus aegyptiacus TaxID=9407 RepID=A0A7J8E7F2_ROUAE|nr:endomucin [Rousettus aegyptiacus]